MGKQFWGTTGLGQGEDFKQSSNTTTSGASETIQIIVLVRVYSQNEKATQRTPKNRVHIQTSLKPPHGFSDSICQGSILGLSVWDHSLGYCQISKNFVLSHPLVTTCAETPEHREKQFPGAAGTQDSRQILRGVNIVWSKELSTRTSCFVLAKLNISFFMPLARIQNIIDTLVKMGCLFPQRRATSWHQHGYSILSCSELQALHLPNHVKFTT